MQDNNKMFCHKGYQIKNKKWGNIMDIYMHQALEKIRNWFEKEEIRKKNLFWTLWEITKKDEKILDTADSFPTSSAISAT